MPEGHKTHRIAIDHTAWLAGSQLRITSPQGRFRGDARKVTGTVLDRVEAVGKHLFYHFDNDRIVQVHLGRYGSFTRLDSPPPRPVGQVRMRIMHPDLTLDLRGPTRCRVIDPELRSNIVDSLGPDPLASGAPAMARRKRTVRRSFAESSKPIAALLLDQSIIAGVGNIFRAEILFEAELDPYLSGDQIDDEQFNRLWKVLLRQMRAGLKYGKIVTVTRREAGRNLADVNRYDRFRIYGHDQCPRCGGSIKSPEIANRKHYYCPHCQPRVQ